MILPSARCLPRPRVSLLGLHGHRFPAPAIYPHSACGCRFAYLLPVYLTAPIFRRTAYAHDSCHAIRIYTAPLPQRWFIHHTTRRARSACRFNSTDRIPARLYRSAYLTDIYWITVCVCLTRTLPHRHTPQATAAYPCLIPARTPFSTHALAHARACARTFILLHFCAVPPWIPTRWIVPVPARAHRFGLPWHS